MLIDKPAGWTSHDVVAVVRRRLGTRAVGHAGTLDPFATGLLIVLVGKATRLARFVEARPKRYHAVVRFGTATDTDDATGTVLQSTVPTQWPLEAHLADAVQSFVGSYQQRPPAFSAKHVGGVRSYTLARRGTLVDLPPVMVTVYGMEIERWDAPDLTIAATVGRGTYLRALARDLGERVGVPAHCASLRRTAIGEFDVADALAPEGITPEALLPPAAMVPELPAAVIDAVGAREIGFGRAVAQAAGHDGDGVLVAEDGRMLAVAEARDGQWHPVIVFEPAT